MLIQVRRIFSLRLTLAGALLFIKSSYAFDPLTAIAVVHSTAQAFDSVSGVAGQVAASSTTFLDLYEEIDSDTQMSEQGKKLIQEVQAIESIAREVGYTENEIEALKRDTLNASEAQKLSDQLNRLTQAIRLGKKAAKLAIKLDQKAKLSEVESAQIEREVLITGKEQLKVLNEIALSPLKKELQEQKEMLDVSKYMQAEEKYQGARYFRGSKVLSFPLQSVSLEKSIEIALRMRPYLMGILLLIFLTRVVFYQLGVFGKEKYGDLLRDTVVCCLLLATFPDIIRAGMSISQGLASSIGMGKLEEIKPGELLFSNLANIGVRTRIFFEWLFQWIKYLAFEGATFISNIGFMLLIICFPLVIFASQMLNFAIAWPIFLGGFVTLCLWPIFWNATGLISTELWKVGGQEFSVQVMTLLFGILQFLSPLIGIKLLNGQGVSSSIQNTAAMASQGVGFLGSQLQGAAFKAVGNPGGGRLGRIAAFPLHQLAGRTLAAGSRMKAAHQERSLALNSFSNPYQSSGRQVPSFRSIVGAGMQGVLMNEPIQPSKVRTVGSSLRQFASGLKGRPLQKKHR